MEHLLSLAIIFIVYYFDTTVKDETDIEKITNLPVIGIIPITKEKIKHVDKKLEHSSNKKDTEVLPIVAMRAVAKPEEPKKEEVKEDSGTKVASAKKASASKGKKKYYYGSKK